MSYFAKVKNGKVIKVIVAEQDFFNTFIDDEPGQWIETFKNGSQRKNFASEDYTYDVDKDAFIPPKPFDSWLLNETTCRWEAPDNRPDDGQSYNWNEETTSWDLVE